MVDVTEQIQTVREAPEIEAYKLGLLEEAKRYSEANPVNLPGMEIAGLTPEQIQARELATQGIGVYQPYTDRASNLYQQAAEGYGAMGDYGEQALSAVREGAARANELSMQGAQAYDPTSVTQYMNPYQQAVTQEALKEMQRTSQIAGLEQQATAVKTGAFGGSRSGVQASELARNLADIQSKRIFEDYAANFSQAQTAAMNAFQNQQTRLQQAGTTALGAGTNIGQAAVSAGQLGQGQAAGLSALGGSTSALGQQISGLGQGDVSFLYNVGEKARSYEQSVLDAARQSTIQQEYEPYQRISFLSDIYKGAPSSQQTLSSTTAPSASLASQAGGVGIAALSAYNLFGGGKPA